MSSRWTIRRTYLWTVIVFLPLLVTTVSTVVNLATSFSTIGKVLAGVFALAALVVSFIWFRPVLLPTLSGRRLLDAVQTEGLEDVVSRELERHHRPPVELYGSASWEVAISALSAYSTFTNLRERVLDFLSRADRQFYVLILDPTLPAVRDLPETVDVRAEIEGTCHIIENEGLHTRPNFHIRLAKQVPTITGTLIDGDIDAMAHGGAPRDRSGHIRMQPRRVYGTVHQGVVVQFRNVRGHRKTPFDYYADELRLQWAHARPAYVRDDATGQMRRAF